MIIVYDCYINSKPVFVCYKSGKWPEADFPLPVNLVGCEQFSFSELI